MPCLHPSFFTFLKEVVLPDVFHGTHLMESCYAQGVGHMRLSCICSTYNGKIPGSIDPVTLLEQFDRIRVKHTIRFKVFTVRAKKSLPKDVKNCLPRVRTPGMEKLLTKPPFLLGNFHWTLTLNNISIEKARKG